MDKPPSFFLRLFRVIIVLAIALGLAKLLISLKKQPEKQEIITTPPSVRVIPAVPVTKIMTVEAFGTVRPRKFLKIAAEVPGRIDQIHPSFIEGGAIHREDLLIGIDQRAYHLERQAAEVRVRQAQTDMETFKQDIENLKKDAALSSAATDLSQKEFMRVKALNDNQFASKTSLDRAEQQYLQTKMQWQSISNRLSLTDTLMEQKKAALSMAKVDFERAALALEKTRILAPFDGFVLDKFGEGGEYVNPGQVLGSVYEKGKLDVDVSIPLENMEWVDAFFENGRTPDAKVREAHAGTRPSAEWDARVARVKAKIDEKTRTLTMTIEIIDPDDSGNTVFDLKPGTFVKCSILGETYEDIFVLPRHLLKTNDILFTVSNNRLEMKKVNVLRKFEEEVYINGGLAPGDNIVSSPLPGALEGMELTIKTNGE